jgi:hypothetical protein
LGFVIARKCPVWFSVFFVVFMEVLVGYYIHDNLMLNIIMLLYPMDWIKNWQMAV